MSTLHLATIGAEAIYTGAATFGVAYLTYFGWRVVYFLIVGDQNTSTPAPETPRVELAQTDLQELATFAIHTEDSK